MKTVTPPASSSKRERAVLSRTSEGISNNAESIERSEATPPTILDLIRCAPFLRLPVLRQRRAERLEQFAIHWIAVGLVFGVPLYAERKTRRVGDVNGLDGAVLRNAFDDHALARFEDALAVQRVDADRFGAKELGEHAAWRQANVVAIGENDFEIGMQFAVFEPRRPMVHAPGQLANLGMQRTAEGDIHLLKTAADAEQWHAALDAGLDQLKRDGVAILIVGLIGCILFLAEVTRMHVGAGAGEQNAVDRIEQRADVGNLRRAGKDQRQGARGLGHRPQW